MDDSFSARLPYEIVPSVTFDRALKKFQKKDKQLVEELLKQINKLTETPELGKPLRYRLRNQRRLHVAGSFVLLYEIVGNQVRLLDFGHHNKIYKKH